MYLFRILTAKAGNPGIICLARANGRRPMHEALADTGNGLITSRFPLPLTYICRGTVKSITSEVDPDRYDIFVCNK